MQERWWSLPRASGRFGISEEDLRIAILSGDLVGVPSEEGGDWLVREGDLLRLEGIPEPIRAASALRSRDAFSRPFRPMLLLPLVLIPVLVVVTKMNGTSDCGSRPSRTTLRVLQISGMIELFHLDQRRYPESLRDLVTRPNDVAPESWPSGGYLAGETDLTDGWGREFIYRVSGTEGRRFDLFSLGADPDDPGDDLWYSR